MLRNCEINVIRFEERFVRGTLDEIWLPEIRGLNWVLLTRDDRWRYNASEMRAIIRTKGKAFVFVPRKLKEEEIAAIIWRAYPKMAEIVRPSLREFVRGVVCSRQAI